MCVCQTDRTLINRCIEQKQTFLNPAVYESNLASHAIKEHLFPNRENIKLIKSITKN